MGRVLFYARVSTIEQGTSGLSLSAQVTRLQAEAAYRGWNEVELISEVASAKSLDRPGLKRALELLASGEADTLVACKLDRLSRSVADFVALVSLADQQKWNLIVLDLGLDLASPNGRFVSTILASVAQLERELIGQRTREALAVKRSQGVKLGRPVGVPADVREFITQARSEGYSLTAIADILTKKNIPTAQGGKRWYPSTISAICA